MLDHNTLYAAIDFAAKAHAGAKRRYSGEPYLNHCLRVMGRTLQYLEVQYACAAVMHDTIEDTDVTYDDIAEIFGEYVADIVAGLTNPTKGLPDPRAVRKQKDRDHLRDQPVGIKIIKMIDRIDNLSDVSRAVALDPGFVDTYIPESWELWKVIKDANQNLAKELEECISYLERTNKHYKEMIEQLQKPK